jgi:hypothetical protein
MKLFNLDQLTTQSYTLSDTRENFLKNNQALPSEKLNKMSFPVAPIPILIQEDMDVFGFTDPIHLGDASMGIIQAPVRFHVP